MPDVILRHVPLPDETATAEPPAIDAAEYERRCDETVARAGTPWVAVYGDREHSANLLFLTGFDPRFEEALLLLGPGKRRVLLVGNEGVVHAVVAGLSLQTELFQGFSLMGQPRELTPRLDRVLADVGLQAGDQVGVVGWKYLTPRESEDPSRPSWVPAVIVMAIQGQWQSALSLTLFNALIVGSVDNVLRPRLVGRDTEMHDLMILFSTLGGIATFGPMGFIIGPILAAVFVTSWEIFGTAFGDVIPVAQPIMLTDSRGPQPPAAPVIVTPSEHVPEA